MSGQCGRRIKGLVMNDIKVSDLISLPVEQNKSRHFGHVVYSTATDEVVFSASSAEIAKYIAHAINSHDQLTEEVERLTAQNKRMLKALKLVNENEEKLAQSWFDCGYHKVIDEILDEAEDDNCAAVMDKSRVNTLTQAQRIVNLTAENERLTAQNKRPLELLESARDELSRASGYCGVVDESIIDDIDIFLSIAEAQNANTKTNS